MDDLVEVFYQGYVSRFGKRIKREHKYDKNVETFLKILEDLLEKRTKQTIRFVLETLYSNIK